tara:strand:+ start:3311 stop:3481 length:171 start_codon:yes stop_codon:yes gene_type:complete
MLQDLDYLLDELEEKVGSENGVYCGLACDYHGVVDQIQHLTKKVYSALNEEVGNGD